MENRRAEGYRQEEKAAQYLLDQGWRILRRNYTIRGGEIDLIARDPSDVLVFVEVRYRKNTIYGDPLETIGYEKQRRVRHAAAVFMLREGFPTNTACRFDVIALYGPSGGLKHITNAF